MGHYMKNDATTTNKVETTSAIGLDGMDARREIHRIAEAVAVRRLVTDEHVTAECYEVAHEHYVEIVEVYRRVWSKLEQDPRYHPTHPAGKTEAFYVIRDRAQR
ncbi:MAG TPA: hypothetical protein VIM31_01330 [Candidatus Microsaccharimonas sp.]|jgi:hypothetical protein